MDGAYRTLSSQWPASAWLARLSERARQRLCDHNHGDLPRWRQALAALPRTGPAAWLDRPDPCFGAEVADRPSLRESLMVLHPWRKGPLTLGGVPIDTEWRSDWKWDRVAPHIALEGCRILDIGCGNGYFGWRMLAAGARLVIGIDPTVLYVMQWLACRHFGGDLPNYVLPLGIEDLPGTGAELDVVFSMGVLYHRRRPLHHLRRIRSLLAPGGRLILETLVLPAGRESDLLEPGSRYARMRNVWAVPGSGRLLDWVREAGYRGVQLVDVTPTLCDEQRSTAWMRFESLREALDPADASKTIEGHPAPVRAIVVAQR
jgi:tRNA (mo5U34)-methyltransferase